uniref:Transposase n=1 Tax=Elaeophora elaphi TaxID=1147741 RepID=A0A0R3RPR8_9BILA
MDILATINLRVWHYIHYTIEFNEKVRKPEERRDMLYIHWLKKQFPALRQYGIPYRESSVDKKNEFKSAHVSNTTALINEQSSSIRNNPAA